MVRAAKKQRNTDSSDFQEAVDASAVQDELAGTGVEHDGAGPSVTVKLSEEEHRAVGDKLTSTLREIERVKQDKKAAAKEFREELADLEEQRDTLVKEWDSGNRTVEPPVVTQQATLPGVVEDTTLT